MPSRPPVFDSAQRQANRAEAVVADGGLDRRRVAGLRTTGGVDLQEAGRRTVRRATHNNSTVLV
jgi:hypothetical protein